MANILVCHYQWQSNPRATIIDYLYSFRRYSGHRVFYFNAHQRRMPRFLKRMHFDLIIFDYSFLGNRIWPDEFPEICARVDFLRQSQVTKVMYAQDEQNRADRLCEFIEDFGIRHVFSCAVESEWPKIYRDVDFSTVGFDTVLTGYVDQRLVDKVRALDVADHARRIDIGYRSWMPWPSLGRHARLKGTVGIAFERAGKDAGLRTDISSGSSAGNETPDSITGDDWYRFLLDCKYTVGVEGGAGILDFDGTVHECTQAYMEQHPGFTFEEVETACFPGRDGEVEYRAISPRHLEACMTRTCQVLIEGHYNGVLRPWEHYIPVNRDLSNVSEVVGLIVEDDLRAQIVDRAYQDVVLSGRYSYEQFVSFFLDSCVKAGATLDRPSSCWLQYVALAVHEWAHRRELWWHDFIRRMAESIGLRASLRRVRQSMIRWARTFRR